MCHNIRESVQNMSETKLGPTDLSAIETFLSDESRHPQPGIFGTLPSKPIILNWLRLCKERELDVEMLYLCLACHMDDMLKHSGLKIDLIHPIANAKSLLTHLEKSWE